MARLPTAIKVGNKSTHQSRFTDTGRKFEDEIGRKLVHLIRLREIARANVHDPSRKIVIEFPHELMDRLEGRTLRLRNFAALMTASRAASSR